MNPDWPWYEFFGWPGYLAAFLTPGHLELFLGNRVVVRLNWGRYSCRLFAVVCFDFPVFGE